jgi:transcriptional regulator with GAF, ATPase, and Fis domain
VSHTIIEKVKHNHHPLWSMNALDDPEFGGRQSVVDLKILSVICVPIIQDLDILGVIYADNRKFTATFNEDTCSFLTSFADQIAQAVRRALAIRAMEKRVGQLEDQLRTRYKFETIIGHSPKMIEVLDLVAQVSDTDAPILIQGETGTGKEIVAKSIHYNSSRRDKPFISINCGALPEQLLESELFGHERGAFTGAVATKMGKFEAAHRGTIFLDEVGEMQPALQVKLLRVLQSGEYSPLGSATNKQSDVRVIAATNQNLKALMEGGTFRQDLYYRLNVVCLDLPPIRERRDDIPLLIEHFLTQFSKEIGKEKMTINDTALSLLTMYNYPGNVRELQNIIRRATILNKTGQIEVSNLPAEIVGKTTVSTEKDWDFHKARNQVIENFERQYLTSLLKQCRGVIRESARLANLDVKNFRLKLKKYGIDARHFVSGGDDAPT